MLMTKNTSILLGGGLDKGLYSIWKFQADYMYKITVSFICLELILETLSVILELWWVKTESLTWKFWDIRNLKSDTKILTLKNPVRD